MPHADFLISFVLVVKNSQKLYPPSSKALRRAGRFFTDFFTGRGRGGWIWLDWVGLGRTGENGIMEWWKNGMMKNGGAGWVKKSQNLIDAHHKKTPLIGVSCR